MKGQSEVNSEFKSPPAPPPLFFVATLLMALVLDRSLHCDWLSGMFRFPIGAGFMGGGVFLIRASMADMKAGKTTYSPYKDSTFLVDGGVFRFSRNPGYLGLAMIEISLAFLLNNIWIFPATALSVAAVTRLVILREEKKLANTFGDQYAAYRRGTRRWF